MENIEFLFCGAELNTTSTHQNQEQKTNWNNKSETLFATVPQKERCRRISVFQVAEMCAKCWDPCRNLILYESEYALNGARIIIQ